MTEQLTEAEEFADIYGLQVICSNKYADKRIDSDDEIYRTAMRNIMPLLIIL